MIKEEIIHKADQYLENISEAEMDKYMKRVSKDQQEMVTYVNTMSDIFDDEDDFFNKFIYFFLLVHRSYTNRFRFFPIITKECIMKIEEEDQKQFDIMIAKGEEEFDIEFENMLRKHPQRVLIDYITMDLFEANDENYDDINLELDNQIFFLLITIINIYERSLVESQAKLNNQSIS